MVDAASAAAAFRERHGLGLAPIRDIIQVAEDYCGARMVVLPLPDRVLAMSFRDPVSKSTIIGVGVSEVYERQRFSVAHELGHLDSGRLSTEVHTLGVRSRDADEMWSDEFARHLLIPKESLRGYLADRGYAPGELSSQALSDLVRTFGVSPDVARIQAKTADWVTAAAARKIANEGWTSRKLARQYGWESERNALVQLSSTPRRPTAIVNAATAAYLAGNITLEALARAAGRSDVDEFRAGLDEDDLVPHPPAAASEDDDIEDFSDLFKDGE